MRRAWTVSFLLVVVVFTFVVRSVFLWRDFVFVYDQGRDALVASSILHGRLVLVGPTTGLFGVFLGPFYYYLLAPLYFIGQGNPIVPAYALVFLTACTTIPLFFLARKMAGNKAAVLATFFYCFSFVQWQYARWLSNPNPLPFVSLLMFSSVLKALETKKLVWFACVGLLLGVCLQLEAANAFFLLPTLISVLIFEYAHSMKWDIKKTAQKIVLDWKLIGYGMLGFFLTLIPQVAFEVKHGFPITKSLITSFQTTHDTGVAQNIPVRVKLLFDLYAKGWFAYVNWRQSALAVLLIGVIVIGFFVRQRLFKIQAFRVISLWFFIPLIFHILYTGNHGNFWNYYIIGQYVPLYLLCASVLAIGFAKKEKIRILSILLIAFTCLCVFVPNAHEWMGLSVPYNERISLSLQLDAINWIEQKANGQPFGMWAYTASAQDEVYKYLFQYKQRQNGITFVEHPEQTKHMYLIVEDDPNNPKRRLEWIEKMSSIGSKADSQKFGAVTVIEVIRK